MDGDDGSTPMEEATTNTITNGMAQIPLPRYVLNFIMLNFLVQNH